VKNGSDYLIAFKEIIHVPLYLDDELGDEICNCTQGKAESVLADCVTAFRTFNQ
jgi:hypothetical protein